MFGRTGKSQLSVLRDDWKKRDYRQAIRARLGSEDRVIGSIGCVRFALQKQGGKAGG
jgi:hypothetical protein